MCNVSVISGSFEYVIFILFKYKHALMQHRGFDLKNIREDSTLDQYLTVNL